MIDLLMMHSYFYRQSNKNVRRIQASPSTLDLMGTGSNASSFKCQQWETCSQSSQSMYFIDATHCLNSSHMPILSFIRVDGNMESWIAAFAIIPDESKSTFETILSIFKEENSCYTQIKTFMVDKCMNESTVRADVPRFCGWIMSFSLTWCFPPQD